MAHVSNNRHKLQRAQSVEIDWYSDHKTILKDTFSFLTQAMDSCICPTSGCPLPEKTHSMFRQALMIGQGGSSSYHGRSISHDSLHMIRYDKDIQHETSLEETDHAKAVLGAHSTSTDSGISDGDNLEYHVENGYLLLINNIWFSNRNLPRNRAEEEGEKIENLFSNLGFKVNYKMNKTKQAMEDILEKLAKPEKNTDGLDQYDCFVCFIMSHGSSKGVHGTDDMPYSLDAIINTFKGNNCKALIGKPKIFLFQSCRGNGNDRGLLLCRGGDDVVRDGDYNTKFTIPTDSDILMVCSTAEGMVSKREFVTVDNKRTFISWFVNAVEEVLSQYARKEDVLKMLTRVNQMVAFTGDDRTGVQMPCQFSTLTKSVFLT